MFITYLAGAAADHTEPNRRAPWSGVGAILDRHREVVERGLVDRPSRPRIRRKFAWLATYHDWYCHDVLDEPRLWIARALTREFHQPELEHLFGRPPTGEGRDVVALMNAHPHHIRPIYGPLHLFMDQEPLVHPIPEDELLAG